MNIKTWIGIGVLAFIVIYAVSLNNSLIEKEEEVNQAWAQVEINISAGLI
jgi:LemA protein